MSAIPHSNDSRFVSRGASLSLSSREVERLPRAGELCNDALAAETSPDLVLEVMRGKTQHPLRPILEQQFLIGSDPGCDLQLNIPGFPPLHSMIRIGQETAEFETLVPIPGVQVNARSATKNVILRDGDTLDFGAIALRVHDRSLLTTDVVIDASPLRILPESAERVAELSASELIELIEIEQQEIERREKRRELGWAALLSAVRVKLDQRLTGRASPRVDSPEIPDESITAVSNRDGTGSVGELVVGPGRHEEVSLPLVAQWPSSGTEAGLIPEPHFAVGVNVAAMDADQIEQVHGLLQEMDQIDRLLALMGQTLEQDPGSNFDDPARAAAAELVLREAQDRLAAEMDRIESALQELKPTAIPAVNAPLSRAIA